MNEDEFRHFAYILTKNSEVNKNWFLNCDTNRQSDVSCSSVQELVALSRPRSRPRKPIDGCHRRHQAWCRRHRCRWWFDHRGRAGCGKTPTTIRRSYPRRRCRRRWTRHRSHPRWRLHLKSKIISLICIRHWFWRRVYFFTHVSSSLCTCMTGQSSSAEHSVMSPCMKLVIMVRKKNVFTVYCL